METKNIYFRSQKVHFKTAGKGQPLLLIHGYQADSRIWDPLVGLLVQNYQVIIPDLPGHGNSPLVQATNTMDFFADALNRICISLGIEYLSVAGHSMGGYAALAFISKYLVSVDKLFLINSHPYEDTMAQILARNRETELLKQGKKHLLLMNYAKRNFYKTGYPGIKDILEHSVKIATEQPADGMIADLAGMMSRPDYSTFLEKARFPVTFIYGENDEKYPAKKIEGLQCPTITIHKIKECGHLCFLEKTKEVAGIMLG